MQAIGALATGLMILASAAVGVRLLALHRRTGGAPELLLGTMLLLTVAIGYTLMIVSSVAGGAWASTLQMIAMVATAAGFSLLLAFTCRVFQPNARWARALTAFGVLMLVAAVMQIVARLQRHGAIDVAKVPLRDTLMLTGTVVAAYLWTAWESLRYHGMMRRRVGLGLADPVLSDRFFLWGVMALDAAVGVGITMVAAALQVDSMRSPTVMLLSSATGLGQAALLVLTFLPPRWYLERVRARAARAVQPS
jgi:hypothetical protein